MQAYKPINHIVKLSKLTIPRKILDELEPIKHDDEAVREYGINMCTDMCRTLLNSGKVNGLHFYTLNREFATIEILKRLGMWEEDVQRQLPWKPTAHHRRVSEEVRPIYWAVRPKSYVKRTSDWDEFPNGRWGNSSSASFGELEDYYLFYLKSSTSEEQQKVMWGDSLETEQDVWSVFEAYLSGKPNKAGVQVCCLVSVCYIIIPYYKK